MLMQEFRSKSFVWEEEEYESENFWQQNFTSSLNVVKR